MVTEFRIRSSIACARCRRSKIKCDNTGNLNAPCENCTKSGNECVWPVPTALPSKRSQPPTISCEPHESPAVSGTGRKRPRRRATHTQVRETEHAEDIFIVGRIERALWDKILVTYQHHFATELSFLHIPTLKSTIYDLSTGRNPVAFDTQLVLLGLLALTGRYHPELADSLHCHLERSLDSEEIRVQCVSDVFAKMLDKALGSFVSATSVGSVERVQALLMLGLYEWISPNHEGLRAWMLVGAAGRMAQALRLGYEARTHSSERYPVMTPDEVIVDREVRRRTMFSCFVFDRLISCGKERPSLIRSEDVHVQLPCGKDEFDLSRQTVTSFFASGIEAISHHDISLLGRFVLLVDLWGRISHYTSAGGRFLDQHVPPWDPQSKFFRLRQDLENFSNGLETPGKFLSLSPANYFRFESASSTYILTHLLMALCKIMLHRQYLPFIPINCTKPCGPLDEPTFPRGQVPLGFWEQSAREVFKASKDVSDVIELCDEKLPHSPLAAFVIYTASFTSIYARYFPHMDTEGYLTSQQNGEEEPAGIRPAVVSTGTTKVMFDALTKLSKYSGVASAFVARFNEADEYFFSMVQDHHRNSRQRTTSQHSGSARLSVRMGGNTGGLEEWVERSESLVSNSSIIKESQQRPHRRQTSTQGMENIIAVDDREVSRHEASNMRVEAPPLDLQPVDSVPNDHASMTTVAVTPLSMQDKLTDSGDHIRTHASPSVPPLSNGGEPLFLEGNDDWSWGFLHDMYLGSVSLEYADSGPSFSF